MNRSDSVKRTASAIVNLGWSYLSDAEDAAMESDPAFEAAVLAEVERLRPRPSAKAKVANRGAVRTRGAFPGDPEKKEKLAEFDPPPSPMLEAARIELVEVDDELLAFIHDHPETLRDLSDKAFEDLMGSVFRNQEFDVERLGAVYTADGGIDLIAISKSIAIGEFRIAVQCKTVGRRSRRQTISARPIRELHGVLDRFRAHKGLLATTGTFTADAWLEKEQHFFRVSLEDRDALLKRIHSLLPEAALKLPGDSRPRTIFHRGRRWLSGKRRHVS